MSYREVYQKLLKHFGKQDWWPGQGFEMAVGALLTQQTSWKNVEVALYELKHHNALSPEKLEQLTEDKLQQYIHSSGFYKQKASRLKKFSQYLMDEYDGDLSALLSKPFPEARKELLSLPGIGLETADSMLLYEGNHPVFIVDAYTKRVFRRLGLTRIDDYELIRRIVEAKMGKDPEVFKQFHALIVELGKNYCKKEPLCGECPLREDCDTGKTFKGSD